MEADYGDVVPRREFERLEGEHAVSEQIAKTNFLSLLPEMRRK